MGLMLTMGGCVSVIKSKGGSKISDNIKRFCHCKDWAKGMPQIVDAQTMSDKHGLGVKYVGEKFKYCPWCGRKLFKTELKMGDVK